MNNKALYIGLAFSVMIAGYSYIDAKKYSAAKNTEIFMVQKEEGKNIENKPKEQQKEEPTIEVSNLFVEKLIQKEETKDNQQKEEEMQVETKKIPVKIEFPNKKIIAPIKPVGLTENGDMDAIDDAKTIGWYENGPSPNMNGNTLLNGHRDWKGTLGTLWKLETYQIGELMTIYYEDGSSDLFALDTLEVYPKDFVPDHYMELGGENRVTVITCAGQFKNGGYQDRVIAIFKKI
ncbi:class F sortase [Calidifontibacillus erzurumensis]|uniref:class F sortase n=1 Tax=Calidifontibacillus erzurumensis TaxID=2741433 RepID=UPI0035B5044F